MMAELSCEKEVKVSRKGVSEDDKLYHRLDVCICIEPADDIIYPRVVDRETGQESALEFLLSDN